MRSLQYRIALILVASIVAVMVVATGATVLVLSSTDSARMVEPMAQHIAFSSEFLESWAPNGLRRWGRPPDSDTGPPPKRWLAGGDRPPSNADGFGPRSPSGAPPPHEQVAAEPADGEVRDDLTEALKAALQAQHAEGEAIVTKSIGSEMLVASYRLPSGRWALFNFPRAMPLPPTLWIALAAWMVAVVAGVVAVALIVARRVTRPFAILERAVTSVGSDGVLPHIPEKGSGEARHTAAVLNRLSDRLRQSMESRMRLVAAAGHDLRTPMTRMRLRAEFLPETDRESWINDLDELEQIADSAIRLVREEVANENRTGIALDELVRATVDELVAAQLPVRLDSTAPAMVRGASLSLRRALRNLVTNAATHGGGAVVRLSQAGALAQVTIDDDGPGIPADLMDRMFEPFFRVDPARGKPSKGAGLGLAIAKEIIERSGGTIEIQNRVEGGLRQVVTLTRLQAEGLPPA